MKKFFKSILVAICVIPFAFSLVACGKDGNKGDDGNKIDAQAVGYSVLKNVADNSKTLISQGRTAEMTSLERNTFDGKLVGDVDEATKSTYDGIISNTKKSIESISEMKTTVAYNEDGTGVVLSKSKDSIEETAEWTEESFYVVKRNNDLVLCEIEKFPGYEDSSVSYYLVDNFYLKMNLEQGRFDSYLATFESEIFDKIKTSANQTDFETKLKNLFIESGEDDFKPEDIKCSFIFSYNETSKIYEMIISLKIENKTLNVSELPTSTTSSVDMNMQMSIKFNTKSVTEIGFNSTIVSNTSMPISDEENSAIYQTKITTINESKCTFTNGIDETLLNNSLIDENYPDDPNKIGTFNIGVYVIANNVLSTSSISYGYNLDINFDNLKNELLNTCIVNGYSCDAGAIKSVKYYLDEAHTIELTSENIKKYPSYNLIIYADIELNDDYATIMHKDFEDGKLNMRFVKAGEISIESLNPSLGGYKFSRIKFNDQEIDLSTTTTLNIEAGKTYYLFYSLVRDNEI